MTAGDLRELCAAIGDSDPIAANKLKSVEKTEPDRTVWIYITDLYHLLEKAGTDGGSSRSRRHASGEPTEGTR